MAEIEKKFGFGYMRLPMSGDQVDIEQTKRMTDLFMSAGFNYFDTAHGYINGLSEKALKVCLTDRYPRDSYILTNKLSNNFFKHEGGIRPLFEQQLKECGVSYFDYYLMHAQNRDIFAKYKRCKAYETAFDLKKEGKIRHVGISFHADVQTLREILVEYPGIEVVQLQFNYLDYENSYVQSKACYDLCVEMNKKVIVMEPVKGGTLMDLPEDAAEKVKKLGLGSAELAIRFAASFDNVLMVLSGMSTEEQMKENIAFMRDFRKLSEEEFKTAAEVAGIMKKKNSVQCTGCAYCMEVCPQKIRIPEIFKCLNAMKNNDDSSLFYYSNVHTEQGRKASDCLGCGNCEKACPQGLKIRKLLVEAKEIFEVPLPEKH